MKNKLFILFVGFLAVAAAAEPWQLPDAKITVNVVEEDGTPIGGASVRIGFMKASGVMARDLVDVPYTGTTGTDGKVSASGPCHQDLTATIRKAGYYSGSTKTLMFQKSEFKRWQPWNQTVNVTLRRIINPIAMYARRLDLDLPIASKDIGFDLIKSDWVSPYGRGDVADIIFNLSRRFKDSRDYDVSLKLTFPGRAEGIQEYAVNNGYYSQLRSPRAAPEGGYLQSMVLSNKRAPGSFVKRDLRNDRGYIIRVRAIVDEQGRVISAIYGKIDGEIRFSPIKSKTCSLMFTYYLNPTPNDRNMEFDPKKNLFMDLPKLERPTAP